MVDLQTLKTTAKLETGDDPDAITYDTKHAELYVFNHRGSSATVIDAKAAEGGNDDFDWSVALNSARSIRRTDNIYCNIEDESEVTAIGGAKHQAIAHWPLAPGTEPSGIALDAVHHRLFATCNNKMLVMLDTKTGKVLSLCQSAITWTVARSTTPRSSSSHPAGMATTIARKSRP